MKMQLKTWYKEFKRLYNGGVQSLPRKMNDYDLNLLSPFMFTVFEMMSQEVLNCKTQNMTYDELGNYLLHKLQLDLRRFLINLNTMVLINISPDFEYDVSCDQKGYVFFNRRQKPLHMKLKHFIQHASIEYMYIQKLNKD